MIKVLDYKKDDQGRLDYVEDVTDQCCPEKLEQHVKDHPEAARPLSEEEFLSLKK